MPRQARIDVLGCLYHIIAGGIERGKIFIDNDDYADFLSRLEKKLDQAGSTCYAFSLLRNRLSPTPGASSHLVSQGRETHKRQYQEIKQRPSASSPSRPTPKRKTSRRIIPDLV